MSFLIEYKRNNIKISIKEAAGYVLLKYRKFHEPF